MKISLALGQRGPLSRQTAWGCFTTNLAMPGFGSLVAGRVSGYFQAAMMFTGLVLSIVGVIRAASWYASNAGHFQDPQTDPWTNLTAMWLAVRVALLGLAVFGFAWFWALLTSLGILRAAKKAEAINIPPRLP